MKKLIIAGILCSAAFFAQAQANEINGNNDCNAAIRSGNCLNNPPIANTPQQQPAPPVAQQPNPHVGYSDGYGHRWNHRNQGGIFFNFQTNPYYNTYNDPNYYDDPYYNDSYPRARTHYPRSYASSNRCTSIAKNLSYSGYRQVRAQKCGGRNYVYVAYRDGDRLRLTVSGSSGRILNIRRIN